MMNRLIILLSAALSCTALPTPQFSPWHNNFFGADNAPGAHLHRANFLPLPYDPYGPGEYGPDVYNDPGVISTPFPAGTEPLLKAPEPAPIEIIPIDLMNAPKGALPKAPATEPALAEGEAAAPAPPVKIRKDPDEPHGIAGTGRYLDDARLDHRYKYKQPIVSHFEDPKTEEEEEVKPPPPEVEIVPAQDGSYKPTVNVGGVRTAPAGVDGPTNFHVWTEEGTKKHSSNEMDPETAKYIHKKMLPKMGGQRKKKGAGGMGGSVFSVFGDD